MRRRLRVFFQHCGEKTVGAVNMGEKMQVLSGIQRDALLRQNSAAMDLLELRVLS